MPRRAKPPDDLFRLFPDLPWRRRQVAHSGRTRVLEEIAAAHVRVAENVRRQMEASKQIRSAVAARQRGPTRRYRRS